MRSMVEPRRLRSAQSLVDDWEEPCSTRKIICHFNLDSFDGEPTHVEPLLGAVERADRRRAGLG
jgi:hypothetical protein